MALLVDANRYSTTTSNQSQITDSRAYNIQYPTYQVQIDSPLASQTTKKEQTSAPSPSITSSASPTTGDTAEVVKTLGIAAIIVYAGVKLLPKVL